jgi:hypothetical protein
MESLQCLSAKDCQNYSKECSELLDNIKPKAKNNKDGKKKRQQTGNKKVSPHAGSNIYNIIHSPHLLLQKSAVPLKNKDTVNKIKPKDKVNKIKDKAKKKKASLKQVSSVMDANFCQTLLHRPHHSLIK